MAKPKLDTQVDEDVFAEFSARAEQQGLSRSALLRELVQVYLSTPAEPQETVTGSADVKVLTAKVDALTRYLCLAHPLDERILEEEASAAGASWARVRKWEKALLKKGDAMA